jgi:hypothetical protein
MMRQPMKELKAHPRQLRVGVGIRDLEEREKLCFTYVLPGLSASSSSSYLEGVDDAFVRIFICIKTFYVRVWMFLGACGC